MKHFFKRHGLSILYLIVLSGIPLLWYTTGTIGLGHDMGWSLVPLDRFFDRFFSWTPTAFGYDQSLEIGAITIYFIPAVLSALHFSIVNAQKITYMFWFFAMGSSMYYFSQTIYKGKYARIIGLLAATFYVLNHYTLQAWTVAEFSKFSAMTIFPILFANLWQVFDKKMPLVKTAAITAFCFFVFNGGGGSGIPLYGGMLISILLLVVYKVLVEKVSIFHILKVLVIFGLGILAVNLYWIVPLIGVIKTQYSPFAASGGASVAVAWTDVISRNTSLLNLFRLQGFSDWYDTTNHPYAPLFLANPLLILASFLFPLLVFSSFFLAKDKREKTTILFFCLLALFSLFFVEGTHPPFGFLYAFLMTKVYGFAIFRTAFYKFGYALWFAYAFLFSFSFIKIASFFKKDVFIKALCIVGFVFIYLYNFPFFTGSFFNFDLPFKTMVQLPQYVLDTKNYIETLPKNDRILLVPPPSPTNGESDVYDFGYFSRTPLPFEISQKSIVTNVEVNSDSEEKLTEQLYKALQQNNQDEAKNLMQLLGINHILLRNDVLTTNSQYRIATPASFSKNFLTYNWIQKEKQFGQWNIYKVVNASSQISAVVPNISFVSDELHSDNTFVGKTLSTSSMYENLLPVTGSHVIVASCETCYDPNVHIFPHATHVVLLPTSPLYFLIQKEEAKNLKNSAGDPFFRLGFDLFYAERHALELRQLSDADADKDTSSLDQYQRYTILMSYYSLLTDAEEKFSQLSNIQKLQSVTEINDSIEAQRRLMRGLKASNFITDNETTFDTIYDRLDSFLSSSLLQTLLKQKQENLLYSVDIPTTGTYTLSVINSQATNSAELDGKRITGTTFSLQKGSHQISMPAISKNVAVVSPTTINGKKDFIISIPNLKPSQLYTLSMHFHNNSSPAVTVEVLDDLNNYKVFTVISPNSSLTTQPFYTTFTTNSAITGPYTIKLLVEQEGTIENSIDLQDITLQEVSSPQVVFSDTAFVKEKKTVVPQMAIDQINPTKYEIHVTNAHDSYVLLFKQTFSPLWSATMPSTGKITAHFAADNAFNAWYIDQPGTYTITLSFGIQKYYIIGVIVSSIGIVCLFGIFLFSRRKQL